MGKEEENKGAGGKVRGVSIRDWKGIAHGAGKT